MIKLFTSGAAALLFCQLSFANDHTFPDITGYEKPYIGYARYPGAKGMLIKGLQDDGKRDTVGLGVERLTLGLKRERYDNKYSMIAIFGAQSWRGDKSLVAPYSEAELNDEIGVLYGSGIHLSNAADWNIFIEASSAEMVVDNKRKTELGVGLGSEILVSLHRRLDVGVQVLISSQYAAGGLAINVNF